VAISGHGIPKKLTVPSLPFEFDGHSVEDTMDFVSLVRLAGKLCEMELVLLNLHFEAMQGSLGFQ